MPLVEYSQNAIEQLELLVRDRGADDHLLDELDKQIDLVAQKPELAEPAKYPIAGGHMLNIHLFDGSGVMWGFTIALRFEPECLIVRSINGGKAPLYFKE